MRSSFARGVARGNCNKSVLFDGDGFAAAADDSVETVPDPQKIQNDLFTINCKNLIFLFSRRFDSLCFFVVF